MNFFTDHPVLFALICSFIAIAYGIGLTVWLLQQPAGNERMREIARAVQEGAAAYLRRQYITVAVVAVVPFLVLGFYDKLGWGTAFGFLIGAALSAAAGFIGMNVAVRSNVAHRGGSARSGLAPALNVAFRAGSVTGLLVVGLGLLGVAGYYWVLTDWLDNSQDSAINDLIGLAFGGSLISVFARLGGGIYTKAADVGADLVGKIEAGIPEDDPRNPAVIADNVGDNVGDCAGMAADLFETYAVTAVAVMLLGSQLPRRRTSALYPLALGGISILASVVGTWFARVGPNGGIMNALYRAVVVATVLSALGFIPVTMAFDDGPFLLRRPLHLGARRAGRDVPARRHHRVLHGHALDAREVDLALVADRSRDEHHRRARRRHAGDRAAGDRDRDRHPRRAPLRRAYGIGVAVMAQLSMTGLIVALDAYGPVTDNAGGIAEMADLPPVRARDHRPARRRRQHDEGRDEGLRDRLGRARRARPLRLVHDGLTTKGFPTALQPLRRVGDRRSVHRRPEIPLRPWSSSSREEEGRQAGGGGGG